MLYWHIRIIIKPQILKDWVLQLYIDNFYRNSGVFTGNTCSIF